ncbi:recombinase RecT [Caloramator sp. Dgby_cultured_2]|uniref:recombinase RecT n=1 Tax=Caloramator sp. Dgby_cultured_2 TaxID=3029174 RepID=UPI00237D5372|nr:recombinase RecT [Caloramator sp. Dgby_cultured_2]WDU84563.1 recombinase RecT [Caloramator sp. Dgby_cultured_2]
MEFDFNAKESDKVIGYAAYFQLINGFEKVVYWPIEKVIAHGQRYSKTFNNGPWKTNFDEMAKKTVLKNTLSKWGILSIEMQTAIKADQAVINRVNKEEIECEYVDNPNYEINYEVKDAENEEIKNIEEEISFEGTPFEENNEELEGQ